jgi:hypothetical protein
MNRSALPLATATCFFENYITEEGPTEASLGPSMTIEEYLAANRCWLNGSPACSFKILNRSASVASLHLRALAECDALLKGIPERTT